MGRRFPTAALLAMVLWSHACGDSIRILLLGDSITHGYGEGLAVYNSYRKALKTLLESNGYDPDFTGSLADGDFVDNQHEGHDGWHADAVGTTNDILGQVAEWMATSDADIVLLHIGTNDILGDDEDANEVSEILDEIFGANSNATVVLALIIDAKPDAGVNADIATYNSNLNTMAQSRISAGDDIIVVDMEHGAGIDYDSSDMADILHPSQTGYGKMATNWYPAVVQAIGRQFVHRFGPPHIDSIMATNNAIVLEIGNTSTGQFVQIEQTIALTEGSWTNADAIIAFGSSTNWTDTDATNDSAFYRLSIP